MDMSAAKGDKYKSAVFQVDGAIIKKGDKCDKLMLLNRGEAWLSNFV